MSKKNLIFYGIVVVGGFLVTNTGVYFLLRATQPKTAVNLTALSDSASASSETLTHHGTVASNDQRADAEEHAALDVNEQQEHSTHSESSDQLAEEAKSIGTNPNGKSSQGDLRSEQHARQTAMTESDLEPASSDESDWQESQTAANSDDADSLNHLKLVKLAKLMESMKPQDAAMVATDLSTNTIVEIMMLMKDRSAAKIMAALPPEVSSRVALQMTELAER